MMRRSLGSVIRSGHRYFSRLARSKGYWGQAWYEVPEKATWSLEPGCVRVVECKGNEDEKLEVLFVRSISGELYAVEAKCPHYGAPLEAGALVDGEASRPGVGGPTVICPWHLAEFDLETGENMNSPSLRDLQTFTLDRGNDGVMLVGKPVQFFASEDSSPLIAGTRARTLPGADTFVLSNGLSGVADPTDLDADIAVLGAGAAGMATVQELREGGFEGSIVAVSEEKYLPYDRIKLSKGAVASEADLGAVTLYEQQWFEEHQVTLLLRTSADGLRVLEDGSTADRRGAVALKASDGSGARGELRFGRAVVATGCQPNRLPEETVPASRGGLVLRSAADAIALQEALDRPESRDVVVVGSSFIGMEVASAIAGRIGQEGAGGLESVTVLGSEEAPLGNVFPLPVGRMLRRLALEKGVTILSRTDLHRTSARDGTGAIGRVTTLERESQEYMERPCDVLLQGVGGRPSPSAVLARGPEGPAETENGRLVTGAGDRQLKGWPEGSVFAAGDVVAAPRGLDGGGPPEWIEHWAHAQAEGRWVGRQLLELEGLLEGGAGAGSMAEGTDTMPFFWTAGFGGNIRFVGHAPPGCEVHLEGEMREGAEEEELAGPSFAAYWHKDGKLHAMAAMGQDPAPAAFAALLRGEAGRACSSGMMPSAEDVISGRVKAADFVRILSQA